MDNDSGTKADNGFVKCPLCNDDRKFSSLMYHIISEHMTHMTCHDVNNDVVIAYVDCWCGKVMARKFCSAPSELDAHLKEHGGIVRHYQECMLIKEMNQ